MSRRSLPLFLVLGPACLGAIGRWLSLDSFNQIVTSSPGGVAPQEVAHALATADQTLAVGLVISIAASLVWLGTNLSRERGAIMASSLVLAGLVTTTWGTMELRSLNSHLAHDFDHAVSAHTSLPRGEAVSRANEEYSSAYRLDGPAYSSIQMAGLTGPGESEFTFAHDVRLGGLALALLAAALGTWRRTQSPETSEHSATA